MNSGRLFPLPDRRQLTLPTPDKQKKLIPPIHTSPTP